MIFIEGMIFVICVAAIVVSIKSYINLMEIKLQNPVSTRTLENAFQELHERILKLESAQYSKEADEYMEKLNAEFKQNEAEDLDNIF